MVYNVAMKTNKEIYDVIIVGGGASGLFFAAGAAASCRGLILEKTGKVGTKLLMSGGGRCNITHSGSIKDFISCYGSAGPSIRKILYKHDNAKLIEFLKERGVETFSEEDGRVFPKAVKKKQGRGGSKGSGEPSPSIVILDLLLESAGEKGFEIKTKEEVTGFKKQNGSGWIVMTAGREYYSRNVVIATGGCSYPKTGSDGKMFSILERDLGVKIVPLAPSLYPIKVADYPFKELAGVSLEGRISFGKKAMTGPILFTHNGFSGPAAINLSGDLKEGDSVVVNYIYPMGYEKALTMIGEGVIGSKKGLDSLMMELFDLPKRFCGIMAERCGGSTKKLAKLLTEDSFTVKAGSFRDAMVTRGGVALSEVDTKSLELVSAKGIYVIGEAMDVDGYTGGYNLQFAYSSAMTAADSIFK